MAETKLQATLRAYLKQNSIKASRLSREAGLHHDAVRNIFRGISQSPRGKTLRALADRMDLSIGDLEPTEPAPAHEALSGEARPADVVLPSRASLPLDMPVMGTAAGADVGAFQIDNSPIDYVRRPPALTGARKPYALYVIGDSMSPAIENGAVIFVDPDRPPRLGDYVVIEQQSHAGAEPVAYVKRLRRRTEKWVFVEQLNPKGEQKFLVSTVIRLHRVLTMNELFGV